MAPVWACCLVAALVHATHACTGAPHVSTHKQVKVATWNAPQETEVPSGSHAMGATEVLVRFGSVGVPPGAAINFAYLQFMPASTFSGTRLYRVRAVANTSVLATSSAAPQARTNSLGSPISVSFSSWSDTRMRDRTMANVTTLLRSFLDRASPAWTTGSAVVFGFEKTNANGASSATIDVQSISLVVHYCAATINSSAVRLATTFTEFRTAAGVASGSGQAQDHTFSSSWTWYSTSLAYTVLEWAYSPIPRGATITRAILSGHTAQTASSTAQVAVRAVVNGRTPDRTGAALNSPPLAADTALSSASVTWSSTTWVSLAYAESPNLATVVQERIASASYAPGDSIVLRFDRLNALSGNRSFMSVFGLQLVVEYIAPRTSAQVYATVLPPRLLVRAQQIRDDDDDDDCSSPLSFPMARRYYDYTGYQFRGVPYGPVLYVSAFFLAAADPLAALPDTSQFPISHTWRVQNTLDSAEMSTSADGCVTASRTMVSTSATADMPHPSSWANKSFVSPNLSPIMKAGISGFATNPLTSEVKFGRLLLRSTNLDASIMPTTSLTQWSSQVALLLTYTVPGFPDPAQFGCATACHTQASCLANQTTGLHSCTCNTGYTGSGLTCTDVNECTPASPCHANAACANSAGSFSCACNAGFTGNGQATCSNINECLSSPCASSATCTDTTGSFSCACNAGFTGSGLACSDVNECQNASACAPNAACTNTPGSFSCACNAGWTGNGRLSCADINECTQSNSTCSSRATCANTPGSFTCTCSAGWTGQPFNCLDVDECSTSPCAANASCSNTQGSFLCACNAGWTGAGTQSASGTHSCADIDECAISAPCAANAVCTNTAGSFVCSCAAGWTGTGSAGCQDVNECVTSSPCVANAGCTNTQGSFTCTCNTGWTSSGFSLCADVDECTHPSSCNAHATCTNTMGSFTCTCNTGWAANGSTACSNIDECALNLHNCSPQHDCVDVLGSFQCICGAGYAGPPQACADLNECAAQTHNCHAQASCLDSTGSFSCACNTGWSGPGLTCVDVDECTSTNPVCGAHANCSNTPGSFACSCNTGWTGNGLADCSDVNECILLNACPANTACTNTPGSFTCACSAGWTGPAAACADVDECSPQTDNCDANAACSNTQGSFSCSCNAGWTGNGVSCADLNECLGNPCSSNAACSNNAGSFTCACDLGWTGNGSVCVDIDECAASDSCVQTCTNTPGSFSCSCLTGWSGDGQACTDIDECKQSNVCAANSACVNTLGSFSCSCNAGWTSSGFGSCIDVNECLLASACAVGAVCANAQGSFSCSCAAGFTGDGLISCTQLNECTALSPSPCSSNAVCQDTPGSFACQCNAGWTGDGLSCTDVDECAQQGTAGCLEPSGCVNTDGSFSCTRDEQACGAAVLRLTSPGQLARLPSCGSLITGALRMVGISAAGTVWQTALASLRTVERYLLLQDCAGFQWSAHISSELRVGSLKRPLLYRDRFAVALINTTSGLTPSEAGQLTETQLAGGDVLVEGPCVVDQAPSHWWADQRLMLNHSLAACGGVCAMHTDGASCVSQCPNRTVCPQACLGRVLDTVAAIRAFPADCQHVVGSLHITGLTDPSAHMELRAALGNVERIDGPLVLSGNEVLIDLSFLAALRSVDSLLVTQNSNLITLYLPLLTPQQAATVSVTASSNPRLCSTNVSVLDPGCATVDHAVQVQYSSFAAATPSAAQIKADVLAQLGLPSNTEATLEADDGGSVEDAIGRYCSANGSQCIARRRRSGSNARLSFTLRVKLASNDSFLLSKKADKDAAERTTALGNSTIIKSKERKIVKSEVDTRLLVTPVFRGRIVQLRVSVGSRGDSVSQAFGSEARLLYQVEPVLSVEKLTAALKKNAKHLKTAVSLTASAKAMHFVRAAHNRGGGALDLLVCGPVAKDRECVRQDWTYRVTVTAVTRGERATAVLPEFSPMSPHTEFNMTATFTSEQLSVAWRLSGTNASVIHTRLEVAMVDGVGQGPRHFYGCTSNTLTPVQLNISRDLQHNPPPQLHAGACHNDTQPGGIRHCWQPWTSYLVSLRPTSSLHEVMLQPASVVAVTPEARPASAVTGLRQVSASASSVTLVFAPPAQSNGFIVGVTVALVALQDNFAVDATAVTLTSLFVPLADARRREQVCSPTIASLQVVVTGLEPLRKYNLTLAPHTSAGEGAVSSSILVATTESQPQQPQGILVERVGSRLMRLTWAPARGTQVRYQVVDAADPALVLTEVSEPDALVEMGQQVRIIAVSALGSSAPSPVIETEPAASTSDSEDSTAATLGAALSIAAGLLLVAVVMVRRRNQQQLNARKLVMDECSETVNQLDRGGIRLVRPLGRGRMGQVFLGTVVQKTGFLEPGDRVAVKSLSDRYGHVTADRVQGFLREIARATELAAAEHPNIIGTFGCCMEPNAPIMLVQEYAEFGSLLEVLRAQRSDDPLNDQDKIMAARDVVAALSYLHSRDYVHRDVAARNCLMTAGWVVKLSDFGSAVRKDQVHHAEAEIRDLPIRWMPPEALRMLTTEHQSKAARRRPAFKELLAQETWSFGVLLWELAADGCAPYGDMDQATVIVQITGGHLLPQPKRCHDLFYELMRGCWAPEPQDRPNMDQLTVQLHELFFQLSQQTNGTASKLGVALQETLRRSNLDPGAGSTKPTSMEHVAVSSPTREKALVSANSYSVWHRPTSLILEDGTEPEPGRTAAHRNLRTYDKIMKEGDKLANTIV